LAYLAASLQICGGMQLALTSKPVAQVKAHTDGTLEFHNIRILDHSRVIQIHCRWFLNCWEMKLVMVDNYNTGNDTGRKRDKKPNT